MSRVIKKNQKIEEFKKLLFSNNENDIEFFLKKENKYIESFLSFSCGYNNEFAVNKILEIHPEIDFEHKIGAFSLALAVS